MPWGGAEDSRFAGCSKDEEGMCLVLVTEPLVLGPHSSCPCRPKCAEQVSSTGRGMWWLA